MAARDDGGILLLLPPQEMSRLQQRTATQLLSDVGAKYIIDYAGACEYTYRITA